MLVDRRHPPDKRAENEQDVYGREKIILKGKLYRREREVKDKIQRERQSNDLAYLLPPRQQKNPTERNSDQNIEKGPNRTEKPGWRRPRGFY